MQLERSLALARELRDDPAQAAALNNLALVKRDAGELPEALALTESALALCAAYGDRHREAALENNLADLHHAAGRRRRCHGPPEAGGRDLHRGGRRRGHPPTRDLEARQLVSSAPTAQNRLLGALSVLAALSIWSTGPAPAAADAPVHNYRGVVPVLLYHGIDVAPRPSGPYSITQAEFARQMAMLASDGFHAISIAQYARFAGGDVAGLPDRPILITFDDGRLDSYQGADAVLARYGMRATMFVITANADAAKPGYLSWPQLRAMAAGGRWDLQEHAHAGHVLIPTGPGRRTGPYYANLIYRNGVRERFSAFKRRVSSDILAGRRLMAAQIPGFEPLAFAVPYSDYGQERTNYAPIPGLGERLAPAHVQGLLRPGPPGLQPAGQPDRPALRRARLHDRRDAPRMAARALPQQAPGSSTRAEASEAPQAARPPAQRRDRLQGSRRHHVEGHAAPSGSPAPRPREGERRRPRARPAAAPGTVYVYRVVAVDAAGRRSRLSGSACARTAAERRIHFRTRYLRWVAAGDSITLVHSTLRRSGPRWFSNSRTPSPRSTGATWIWSSSSSPALRYC